MSEYERRLIEEMYDDLCEIAYFLEQKSSYDGDDFSQHARIIRETLTRINESEQEDIH